MTSKKSMFGALALILLAATVFADGLFGQDTLKESQVIVTPPNDSGTIYTFHAMIFEPATSTGGTNIRDIRASIYQECRNSRPNDIQTCMNERSAEAIAASREYQMNLTSPQGAEFSVQYFNPQGNANTGLWSYVPGCEEVVANTPATAYRPSSTSGGAMEPVTYYVGQCDIAPISGGQRTYIRINYLPGEGISASSDTFEYMNPNRTPASEFAQSIQNFINNVSQSPVGAGGSLPCMGVFLIMGLLLASLYFSGKSPISLLDLTTPRLPAPKGVTASGQILAPFGYTEMKRTTQAKMTAAAAAAATTTDYYRSRMRGNSDLDGAMRTLGSVRGTGADRAAGDVEQQKKISAAFITAGAHLGMKGEQLRQLADMPGHYSEGAHRTAAQIIEALEARGGRDALLAMTLKDYLYSLRTFQSLEVLTAHPEIGKRSRMHYTVSSTLGKAFGANRYAILSGVVMAGTDSTFRTGRMVGRMGKAMVTEAPAVTRSVARTTMEMLGGPRAMEALEARGKSSPAAAWMADQMQKHPSKVVVGSMFPINDKMGHLYRTLHDEALRDEMRYVLKRLYGKYGVRFDVSEAELASMGSVAMEGGILGRSNYHSSKELLEAERQVRDILKNSAMSTLEKLNALSHLAVDHGVDKSSMGSMLAFNAELVKINTSAEPDHMKFISLQQAIESQNKVKMAARAGSVTDEKTYVCHVGGEPLRGPQIWETMVLRTMIWDGENGYLKGGLKEELISAKLNVANRLATLDPTSAMGQLPEHMRNAAQLKAVAQQNREELLSLFSDEGRKAFTQFSKGKSMNSASIEEIVHFMYGGLTPRITDIDKKTGRMTWRASDKELQLPQEYTLVDTKRHWVTKLDSRENFAIGQWVESRATRSYSPMFKASIEAELNRMSGSASWSPEQRTQMMKKLWVADQLVQDMEQRFNSHFGQNTYGTTRETSRFYAGVMAGFMEKALQEKGMESNHPDMRFISEMDMTNPKHLGRLKEIMETHKEAYQKVITRDMTYDDLAKSNKAVVMLHEGGYAYYKKGMMLSDMDRVMAGGAAMRDEKGVMRPFIPEDVVVNLRDDLQTQYNKLRSSHTKDPNEWKPFIESAIKWADEGGYNFDRKRMVASVMWEASQKTFDYSTFWDRSGVSVEAKRTMAPTAPSVLRFFGSDGHTMTNVIKPFRDIGMHGGDYISKVALAAGGDVHRASYDITAVSSQMRMHSFKVASQIQSGQILNGLSEEERVAYRAVAAQHGSFVQVWQYAIDRNPWRTSTSFGTHQAWSSFFHFGPAVPFNVKDNLRAFMGKGEYTNFMSLYGFPMDLANKMMRPYVGMMRGMQMSMQGYASKWDSTGDALRQWNYTEPRVLEAMQSLNPFSFKWFPGKNSERLAKLNVMGGSLERHQLSGSDYLLGLRQAPQDIFLSRKGVYASARTEDANPGETYYDYRMTMKADAPMAEYLFRTKEASYMYDRDVYKAAMDNTSRRTVSAEALALRRDSELRGFGVLANSLFGWANPLGFIWHMPVPLMPQSATPKELVSKYVARSKHGYGGGGFGDSMRQMAEGMGRGATRLFQPHKISMITYCPKCGTSNYRGSYCKNQSCKFVQY